MNRQQAIVGLSLVIYLAVGGLIFNAYDRQAMEQDVPYGDWPSIAPLPVMRRAALLVCVIGWLPICVIAVIKAIADRER